MLPIAYQLYSAREETAENLEKVFSTLYKIGYDGVEFAGFFEKPSEEIKNLLEKYQLKGISSHVGLEAAQKNPFGLIAYHQAIGCEYMVIPGLDMDTRPGGKKFAATLQFLQYFGKLCKQAGIKLLYHNHDFEFIKVGGQYGLDFIFDAIPQKHLATQLDTCWVHYAGLDPVEYILKYTNRAPLVHVKDYIGNPSNVALAKEGEVIEPGERPDFMYKPLGQGVNNIRAIVKAAKEAGSKWLVMEMDDSPEMPPLEAAKICYDYLKPLA